MVRFIVICFSILFLTQCPEITARDSYRERSGMADSLFRRMSGLSGEMMLRMADSSLRAENTEEALSVYMIVSRRQSESTDSIEAVNRVRAYVSVGDIMMRQCDYAEALDNYIHALIISEKMPSWPMAATIYKNIGNIYCCLHDYETGVRYYKRALAICRKYPDPEVEKKILANLSGMITYIGDTGEAERYREIERRKFPPNTNEEIFLDRFLDGLILRNKGRYDRAVGKFRETVGLAAESGIEPRYRCSAYQEMYTTYMDMNKPDSAVVYMLLCREEAERNGMEMMFPSVYDALSDYYTGVGNIEKAREYRARYFDIRDSIMNERDFNAVKNVLSQYKASQTADEIRSLYQEKKEKESIIKKQSVVLWSFIIGLGLLIVVSVFFYIQKRRITRSYRSLYEIDRANAEVKAAMDERHRADILMIEQQEEEIAGLKAVIANAASDSGGAVGNSACVEPAKYSTSNLRDIHRDKLAEAITAVMEENHEELCNPEFSLERLAKIVGSNSKYVSQTINEEFNKNFSNYVNYYRVKLACGRLADRDYDSFKIKYIGESVGFKSQTTFTEVFRKYTGLSPSVYRKMAKAKDEEREKDSLSVV